MFKYAVVVFQTSNGEEVDAVPLFWLSQDRTCCAWPPKSTPIHMIVKAVKSLQIPETDWLQFTVKCLGVYEEYETARKKAKKGEITSDLDTGTSDTEKMKSEKRKKMSVDDFPNENDVDINTRYMNMNNVGLSIDVGQVTSKKKPKTNKDNFDNFDFQMSNKCILKNKPDTKKLLLPPQPPLRYASDQSSYQNNCQFESRMASTLAPEQPVLRHKPPFNTARFHSADTQIMHNSTMHLNSMESSYNSHETVNQKSYNDEKEPQDFISKISSDFRTPQSETTNYLPRTEQAVYGDVIKLLVEVKKQNDDIKAQIQYLSQQQNVILKHLDLQVQGVNSKLPENLNLPLQTFEQVQSFEKKLRLSALDKLQLTQNLGLQGGATVKETVRRVMKMVMTDELANKFNFMGHGNKHAFSALHIKDIVCDSVRANTMTKDAKNAEIESAIKTWLRVSSDRGGGRKKRAEAKTNAEAF